MATWNAHCRVLDGIDVTREQYVERSKEHALALMSVGRIREAVASMMIDMRKRRDLKYLTKSTRSVSLPPRLAMPPWRALTLRVLTESVQQSRYEVGHPTKSVVL
jgi:hypothetical protein